MTKKQTQKKKMKHTQNAEARILVAAEKVFAEKGLHGARIREIAKLGKVPPSQVIYYYKNKENLYKAVIENYYTRVERRLYLIIMEDSAPREKLKRLIIDVIDILAENDHAARILLRESIDKGKYVNEMLSKPYLRGLSEMTERFIFSTLKDQDKYPNDALHLTSNIFGCLAIFFLSATTIKEFWKKDVYSKRMIEERKRAVVEFVFNGIGDRFA